MSNVLAPAKRGAGSVWAFCETLQARLSRPVVTILTVGVVSTSVAVMATVAIMGARNQQAIKLGPVLEVSEKKAPELPACLARLKPLAETLAARAPYLDSDPHRENIRQWGFSHVNGQQNDRAISAMERANRDVVADAAKELAKCAGSLSTSALPAGAGT